MVMLSFLGLTAGFLIRFQKAVKNVSRRDVDEDGGKGRRKKQSNVLPASSTFVCLAMRLHVVIRKPFPGPWPLHIKAAGPWLRMGIYR